MPGGPIDQAPRWGASHRRDVRRRSAHVCLLLLFMISSAPSNAAAARIVAVISSSLPPYVQALEGFRETVGAPFATMDLTQSAAHFDTDTEVVVAFGGKAAVGRYPNSAALVYCMAPGTNLAAGGSGKGPVRVHMLPHPGALIAGLKTIQPSASRLAVIWSSDGIESYLDRLRDEARAGGIEVLLERAVGNDLPSSLRRILRQRPDALWLPPDPLLVNPEAFSLLKGFTWSNRIPFYAPSDGLVERGAVASVACNFREIGRAAGRAARVALAGRIRDGEVYPERIETSMSVSAAAACGLSIPPDVLRRADRVYP